MDDLTTEQAGRLSRAQGCLLGQAAGDSLGSLVEFQSAAQIRRDFPDGVRRLRDGGAFDTLAGQPTDDTEMALMLARSLAEHQAWVEHDVLRRYRFWLDSGPFDCGITVRGALRGVFNPDSQANGALMRVAPLGVFGAGQDPGLVAGWAEADARLTHVHPVCVQVNAVFAVTLASAIDRPQTPTELHGLALRWARDHGAEAAVLRTLEQAARERPADYQSQMGWVLIALQNAFYQLLHAPNLEEGVVDTVMQGGDTDTNATIAGALLGAAWGRGQVPGPWQQAVLSCRPQAGLPGVKRPRPEVFWPVDILELAGKLLGSGR